MIIRCLNRIYATYKIHVIYMPPAKIAWVWMEKALELRQSLSRLDEPEERPSSAGYRFQPWSQESYCKRLFTFSADRWTSRPRSCESPEAALNGWVCSGKDLLLCNECNLKLNQPWLPDMNDELGIRHITVD